MNPLATGLLERLLQLLVAVGSCTVVHCSTVARVYDTACHTLTWGDTAHPRFVEPKRCSRRPTN